ncbi:MAG: hypothetical protein LAN64_04740 [Acidobacteriia bacterium]|nr:hypothetical protein [Terriglobia bacterium]
MNVDTRQKIEERIREIDELLRSWEACEMTEGWLSYGPDTAEVAKLYQERERLLQELAKAA